MFPHFILAIAFGLVSVYTDVKERVIKNHLIVVMLLTSLVLHSYILLFSPESFGFLPNFMVNLLFSIAAGIILWIIYIWPAGDAKLFIAYSSLLPLSFFLEQSFPLFRFPYKYICSRVFRHVHIPAVKIETLRHKEKFEIHA